MKVRLATVAAALVCAGMAPAAPVAWAAEVAATMSVEAKFQALDANRSGFITKGEVRRYRDYGRAFDEADQDRDGKLNADEFIKSEAIYQRLRAAEYIDDSIITAKVKAALLKEMNSADVKVETQRGRVLLSGHVADKAQRAKALKVAASVSGVVKVEDRLAFKSDPAVRVH
ncbi:MAG: BON domain-containing protein [Betaproteobacteria bacterium]|nr:BON domain-containing protein [Betaproteobacteria bacterium]